MIKIAIHGTKGGFNLIHGEQRLLSDPSADTTTWQAIGQKAYSLMLINDSCVFSQYRIIRDVIGDKRTGNIAFSVIIPNNQKLSGTDLKSLLDKIADVYSKKYIVGNNLDNVHEDWSFINAIAAPYESRLKSVSPDDENLPSGTQDAAFVYYTTDEEVQKYFDAPYQDEYRPFKQVFFVKSDLQGKPENPLNALRHSGNDLTEKIDLDNPKYKLKDFYERGKDDVTIAIWVNGDKRSNKGVIKRKDTVRIRYSKNDEYFNPIDIEKKLTDSDILNKYLFIIDENKITVKNDVQLSLVEQPITFKITDRKGSPISDAKIQIGTQGWQKISGYQHKHTFKGEELGNSWTVSAKKGDRFSVDYTITPKNQNGVLDLVLEERKKVKIDAMDDSNVPIQEYKLSIGNNDNNIIVNKNEIEFIGEAIEKECDVIITSNGYDQETLKGIYPKSQDEPIVVNLKKIKDRSGNKIDGTLVAQCVKKKPWYQRPENSLKIIAGLSTICLAGIVALCFLIFGGAKIPILTPAEITTYVEGDSLFIRKLNKYETNWEQQKPEISRTGSMLGIGGNPDSTKHKEWDEVKQRIDSAICKRRLINEMNFAELKSLNYDSLQQKFKEAVDKLDSTQYENVKEKLGDVSNLTLTRIADSINVLARAIGDTAHAIGDTAHAIGDTAHAKQLTTARQSPAPKPIQKVPPDSVYSVLDSSFFSLIHEGNTQMGEYTNLCKQYRESGATGEILEFLKKITKDSKCFKDHFKTNFDKIRGHDRDKIQSLTELKEKINMQ